MDDNDQIAVDDPEYNLHCIRHSAAHMMASAVQEVFPEAKFAIGPVIKDGFYYDMDLPRALTPEDLDEIEKRMKKLVKSNLKFEHDEWDKDQAKSWFSERSQDYKMELIDGIEDEKVHIYKVGEFTDLCAGPHVRYSKKCKHFKLLKFSGAYWRGDEKNPMLQRIYGTAWSTKDDLEQYLYRLEEAKKRDHRKIGKELELFFTHEYAPGCPFWLPKGNVLFQTLSNKMREYNLNNGYVEVRTPQVFRKDLWETSGHWEHFKDDMFIVDDEDTISSLKPMNCPSHMLIFKSKQRSYRDLPLRIHDQGVLHRNEKSGVLSGLTRVRMFSQDDAHLFVTPDQLKDEIMTLLGMIKRVYTVFEMDVKVFLSTRPDKFMGDPELWDQAEKLLAESIQEAGLDYTVNEGDGAFYGPKIDYLVVDALGREWQTATTQLDFQLPRRFDLKFVDKDNDHKHPIVIHRALYGSLERFIGILIEHYAGAFPFWLAPVQCHVINLGEAHVDYAEKVHSALEAAGIRSHLDTRNESVGYKIRQAQLMKIPYMLVLGDKELENSTVALRELKAGDQGAITLEECIERFSKESQMDF